MSLYDYDKLTFVGRVGKDAEMRYLPFGSAVTSFSVAVDRSYKDRSGELVKRTIWYRVSVFGNFAEVCAKIKKGEKVLVEGDLEADWETGSPRVWAKQDGSAGASFDVHASTVRFLSPRSDGAVETAKELGGREQDDIPF